MQVTVKLGTTLRQHAPEGFQAGEGRLELPQGARVSDLVAKLELEADQVNIIYRNHRLVGLRAPLSDGDRIALFPPNFIHFSQFYLKREE